MAKLPSQVELMNYLTHHLDWSGHVELPDLDLKWLAGAIIARFDKKADLSLCDSCGMAVEMAVMTRLGTICKDCLEEATEELEEDLDSIGE